MQADAILTALSTTQRAYGQREKDYVKDLLDWEAMDDAMKRAVEPSLLQVLIETGKDAMDALGLQPSLWDPYEVGVREYLAGRTTKIAADVNDETEKQLRATLTEGLKAGEGVHQLRARVEAVMGIAATTRADVIARTEVARVQSAADIYAWDQSGVVEGKEWFTAEDERVCKFCGPMNGRVIGLRENFFEKGDVQTEEGENRKGEKTTYSLNHDYDSVPGAPLHPRCRCTLLPVRTRE
jgi:SPP1 gp7 family putative phage head morphogenesis protein